MCRSSSPGAYSLCSANSTDWPWWGLRCSPESTPSTMAARAQLRRPGQAREHGRVEQAHRRLGHFTCSSSRSTSVAARHALALGAEVGEHAVASTGRASARTSSTRGHEAPVEDGAGLGAEDQVLAGARAGAPGHVLLARSRGRPAPWGAWRAPGPPRSAPRGRPPARAAPAPGAARMRSGESTLLQRRAGRRRWWSRTISTSSSADGVVDVDVEHEAVELGLGQRVGALLLDGVLRGEHEERQVERVGACRRR